MAFYDLGADAPRAITSAAIPQKLEAQAAPFDPSGRLGVLVGAGALGAMTAAVGAFAIGAIAPLFAASGVAALCVIAAFYAGKSFLENAERRDVIAAVLIGVHAAALIAWPVTLQVAPEYAAAAFGTAIGSVLAYAAATCPTAACMGRLALHAALFAAAASYQGLFTLFGG
jgi:hypothetical protein